MPDILDYISQYISPSKDYATARRRTADLFGALAAPAKFLVGVAKAGGEENKNAWVMADVFRGTPYEQQYINRIAANTGMGVGSVGAAKDIAKTIAQKAYKGTLVSNLTEKQLLSAKTANQLPIFNISPGFTGKAIYPWEFLKKEPFDTISGQDRIAYMQEVLKRFNTSKNPIEAQISKVYDKPQPLQIDEIQPKGHYDFLNPTGTLYNTPTSNIHSLTQDVANRAGYTVPAYKGSMTPISGQGFRPKTSDMWEPGYFFTPESRVASHYTDYPTDSPNPAELIRYLNAGGPQSITLPVWLRMQNSLTVGKPHMQANYSGDRFDEILRNARNRGYDSVLFHNIHDVGGKSNQLVVFDPSQIRLPWAKFKDTTSPDLLGMHAPLNPDLIKAYIDANSSN